MNILIVEPNELHSDAVNLLKEGNHNLYFPNQPHDQSAIDAIFIRTYTKANSDYLNGFPNLKYILRAGVGLDNIDLKFCENNNIIVFNSPGANANAVAEYSLMALLVLIRNVTTQMNSLVEGSWRDRDFMGNEISNITLGLVGCGAIGRLFSEKVVALGCEKVIGFDPFLTKEQLSEHNIEKLELNEVLAHADVVSLHLPLTEETKHMINEEAFDFMKNTGYLINAARGGIVDENALMTAVNTGSIAGVALDVFENEPKINTKLLETPGIISTPHIAAMTMQAEREMSLSPVNQFLDTV